MRIGILTYHRTNNYGALLQAIATRVYLQQLGHEAYYIDYWPEYHKNSYAIWDWGEFKRQGLIRKIKFLFSGVINYKGKIKRINSFTPFLEQYIIPFCKPFNDRETYDVIIYGSDQIWRKQKGLGNKFNPVYFGQHIQNCNHKIAYAASMGDVNLNENDIEDLASWLSDFDAIGVRENNILDVLKTLQLKNAQLTVDPTMLLDAFEWDKVLKPKRLIDKPYAVVYQLYECFDMKEIKKFCKIHNLRLVVIPAFYSIRNCTSEFSVVSPFDFISLIKYADFSFISSFHGLVFSIIYGVQFFASFSNASDRAKTLLSNLGLQDRFYQPKSELPLNYSNINYANVHEKLNVIKKESFEFLDKINAYD